MAADFSYGGEINAEGFGGPSPLAGRYLDIDPERIKQFKDAFGNDIGAMAYLLEQQRTQATDPQRIKEMLAVIEPYQKRVALENQRLGMESALFGGFLNLPEKLGQAISAQRAYGPEILQTISQASNRPSSFFVPRQYVSL